MSKIPEYFGHSTKTTADLHRGVRTTTFSGPLCGSAVGLYQIFFTTTPIVPLTKPGETLNVSMASTYLKVDTVRLKGPDSISGHWQFYLKAEAWYGRGRKLQASEVYQDSAAIYP